MNKEEILQASRKENKDLDLYRLEIENKAQNLGGSIAVLAAMLLALYELKISGMMGGNYAGYAFIVSAFYASTQIYKAVKLKTLRSRIYAVILSILTVSTAVMQVYIYLAAPVGG